MGSAPLIPANWQLPESLRQRLGRGVGRQRVIMEDGNLLIVAHVIPEVNETVRTGILFWLDVDHQWRASNGDPGTVAIENLLEKYEKKIEQFDLAESKAILAEDYLQLMEGLAPVARAAQNLYAVMEDARKSAPDRHELLDLRDRAYEISRNAELVYQYARNSMDVAVIRRAEEQAHASDRMALATHKLNMMAALFFPLATLGTIFGTTLTENWSWSEQAGPFVLFILVGTLAGILLAGFVSRNKKK